MLRSELLQQHGSEYRCIFWRILSDGLTVIFNRAVLSVPPVRQPVQNVYPGALGADGEENGRDGQPPAAKQCRERWNWGRNRGRRGRRWGKQQSVTGKNSTFCCRTPSNVLRRRPPTLNCSFGYWSVCLARCRPAAPSRVALSWSVRR